MQKFDDTYMQMAQLIALHSKAVRAKVGAILLTPHNVILAGYNGTPSGLSNDCENEVDGTLVTKPDVIHAELNAILKAAKEGVSVVGSTVYVTLAPCVQCSAMLAQSGVKRVVFGRQYRDDSGILLLKTAGVVVEQIGEMHV